MNSKRNKNGFNPHEYFGGWSYKERSSKYKYEMMSHINMIQTDNLFEEMFEYDTSNESIEGKHLPLIFQIKLTSNDTYKYFTLI